MNKYQLACDEESFIWRLGLYFVELWTLRSTYKKFLGINILKAILLNQCGKVMCTIRRNRFQFNSTCVLFEICVRSVGLLETSIVFGCWSWRALDVVHDRWMAPQWCVCGQIHRCLATEYPFHLTVILHRGQVIYTDCYPKYTRRSFNTIDCNFCVH